MKLAVANTIKSATVNCMDNQQFLCRKISIFAFSGMIRDLSGLIVSPAVENTLSDGVEDA